MSGSPKGKKEKNEEGQRGTIPLNPLEVSSARGEGAYNNRGRSNNSDCLFLCLCLLDQKQQSAIRAQIPSIWSTGSFLPTLTPVICVQGAPGTGAPLPAMWLGLGEG